MKCCVLTTEPLKAKTFRNPKHLRQSDRGLFTLSAVICKSDKNYDLTCDKNYDLTWLPMLNVFTINDSEWYFVTAKDFYVHLKNVLIMISTDCWAISIVIPSLGLFQCAQKRLLSLLSENNFSQYHLFDDKSKQNFFTHFVFLPFHLFYILDI